MTSLYIIYTILLIKYYVLSTNKVQFSSKHQKIGQEPLKSMMMIIDDDESLMMAAAGERFKPEFHNRYADNIYLSVYRDLDQTDVIR